MLVFGGVYFVISSFFNIFNFSASPLGFKTIERHLRTLRRRSRRDGSPVISHYQAVRNDHGHGSLMLWNRYGIRKMWQGCKMSTYFLCIVVLYKIRPKIVQSCRWEWLQPAALRETNKSQVLLENCHLGKIGSRCLSLDGSRSNRKKESVVGLKLDELIMTIWVVFYPEMRMKHTNRELEGMF